MSLKKKTEVRTGKMVRELMLADEEVSASLIMVYSDNGVNVEIKIEGLHPKSNEELFLSGKVDWNRSVIYKIVDFSGKAEVGKVMLTEMKKNNVTLQIERVMWSKDKQGEEAEAASDAGLALVHTDTPEADRKVEVRTEFASDHADEEEAQAAPAQIKTEPKPVQEPKSAPQPAAERKPAAQPVQSVTAASLQQANERHTEQTELHDKYDRLLAKAKDVCFDYSMGLDLDDAVEALTDELQAQGVELKLDADVMDTLNRLRALKDKGLDPRKLINLL